MLLLSIRHQSLYFITTKGNPLLLPQRQADADTVSLSIMAYCSQTVDLGDESDWEVLDRDEITGPQSAKDDSGTIPVGSKVDEGIHEGGSTARATRYVSFSNLRLAYDADLLLRSQYRDPRIHQKASNRDMHFAKLNDTLTGNVSRGLCFENICGPPGSFQIDVETEEGRVITKYTTSLRKIAKRSTTLKFSYSGPEDIVRE